MSTLIAICMMALIGCVSSAMAYGADITVEGDQEFVDMYVYNNLDDVSFYVDAYNIASGMTLEVSRQLTSDEYDGNPALVNATFEMEGCGCDDSVSAEIPMEITNGSLVSIKNGAITIVSFPWSDSYSGNDLRVFNDGTVEILDAMG